MKNISPSSSSGTADRQLIRYILGGSADNSHTENGAALDKESNGNLSVDPSHVFAPIDIDSIQPGSEQELSRIQCS